MWRVFQVKRRIKGLVKIAGLSPSNVAGTLQMSRSIAAEVSFSPF